MAAMNPQDRPKAGVRLVVNATDRLSNEATEQRALAAACTADQSHKERSCRSGVKQVAQGGNVVEQSGRQLARYADLAQPRQLGPKPVETRREARVVGPGCFGVDFCGNGHLIDCRGLRAFFRWVIRRWCKNLSGLSAVVSRFPSGLPSD